MLRGTRILEGDAAKAYIDVIDKLRRSLHQSRV